MDSNQPQQHTPPNFHDFSTNLRGRKDQPPEATPRPFRARGWPWPGQATAEPCQASAQRQFLGWGCREARTTATFARRERFNRPCAQARKEKCQVLSKPRAAESIFESNLTKKATFRKNHVPKNRLRLFFQGSWEAENAAIDAAQRKEAIPEFWGGKEPNCSGNRNPEGKPQNLRWKAEIIESKFSSEI